MFFTLLFVLQYFCRWFFFLLLESKLLEEKDAALFIVNPLEYLTQNRPSIFIQLVITYLFTLQNTVAKNKNKQKPPLLFLLNLLLSEEVQACLRTAEKPN